ncbi:MAG: signal recognition particle protein [Armatimonadota bacterium]|nr:signal recognition particle protein [Armatimonadota bacterium]MDR7402645.1 signal recognition particle protein [Armatimonadota bacterium]MDR7404885.1 signal recognition particle protein [Armatimonadota bacterium]MDR7436753.1 signal recognition particle protein [Armatimonadota bacterium]MDR7472700.1 signal recognition particle protein [Armatimonadota bacterium]
MTAVFDGLHARLQLILTRLTGRGVLTEADVDAALREVRRALLEADVHYQVARAFTERVRAAAVGQQVLQHLAPGHQVVKIVYQELVRLLGGTARELRLADPPPAIVILAGLHGSGKTTTAAKLGRYLARRGRRPVLVAADLRRPAAVSQLEVVARQAGVPVFAVPGATDPQAVAAAAVEESRRRGCDVVIVDSAGRPHADEALMEELRRLRDAVRAHHVLLVVDAMTGQQAVAVAQRFQEAVGVDGLVVTKLDGDARGGAVLSVVEVTGAPVLFAGVGETVDGLEPFHPDRMASRILGMGDVLTLIEKAQEALDAQQAAALERRLRRAEFTLDDFRAQLAQVRRLGPVQSWAALLPAGLRPPAGVAVDEAALRRAEAIIASMTPQERRHPEIIDGSRRRRIARGSGTTVQDVNRLLRQFEEVRRLVRQVAGREDRGRRGRPGALG